MPTKLKQIPKIAIFSHFFQFANYSMGNTETFSKYSTRGLLSSEKKTDIFVFLLSPVNSFKKSKKMSENILVISINCLGPWN